MMRIVSKVSECLKLGHSTVRSKVAKMSSLATRTDDLEERKVKVDGIDINYLRVGAGEHPVLLLPGALGTIWTDFKPQIENLDREKFTVVAWDPPGYGKSRPPDRTFPDDFFQRDAAWAHGLMKTLGYEKFSLLGWSDGGITSLMLAATFPDSVRKMIAIAANAYVLPEEAKIYESIRNIDKWSEKMKAPMIEAYGEEYFRKTWSDWVTALLRIYETQEGNLCKEMLPAIKCPTLIVQGKKDPLVLPEHPVYLNKHIAGSIVHILEKGSHNCHMRYWEEFNRLATAFLTGQSKM